MFGGTATVLNVTSQKWMDESKGYIYGLNTAVWSHQVAVIVPKELTTPGIAISYLTGNCNELTMGNVSKTDEELLFVDEISHATGAIGIIVFQIPNCP